MPWAKEEAFRVLLQKISTKATPERLAKAADLALEDNEAAVKYVSGMILKEMKQLKAQYKLRIFYAFSSIARASVAKYGSRSKYTARWAVKLETIAGLLSEIPPEDKVLVARVLQLWWRDGVFPPSALTRLQSQFPASPEPTTHKNHSAQRRGSGSSKHKTHLHLTGASTSAAAAPSSSVERTLRYWDEELGTEVVITSAGKHDAPASPVRRDDQPAQEPSPVDESPLPEQNFPPIAVHTDGVNEDGSEEEEKEEESMPSVPKRQMFTLLQSNKKTTL